MSRAAANHPTASGAAILNMGEQDVRCQLWRRLVMLFSLTNMEGKSRTKTSIERRGRTIHSAYVGSGQ